MSAPPRDDDATVAAVARFLDGAGEESFETLALRVFAWQYERVAPYRRFCDARGRTPATVDDWRQTPMVPIVSFRTQAFHGAPSRHVFRSSGTTAGDAERSAHHHPFPELYRRFIDRSFATACFPAGAPRRRPLLALVPSGEQVPDSSLGFMVDHLLDRHGDAGSVRAFGPEGVDAGVADAFCERAMAEGKPVTVLATAFALLHWLEFPGTGTWRLPPGSTLFETGGFKGRAREIGRDELVALVAARLGIAADHQVREYGMTELTGHFYTDVLQGGDPDLFRIPPSMRVRVLDPETLEETQEGQSGLLAIFDLANIGSAAHLLTQDLGVKEGPSHFRLAGRATGAALRGCSLTAEELRRAST